MNLLFDHSSKLANETSTSWVQFGSLLQAYRFPMRQGDHLIIESTHAWLPVNKSWILVMGLAGRFGRGKIKESLQSRFLAGLSPNKHGLVSSSEHLEHLAIRFHPVIGSKKMGQTR